MALKTEWQKCSSSFMVSSAMNFLFSAKVLENHHAVLFLRNYLPVSSTWYIWDFCWILSFFCLSPRHWWVLRAVALSSFLLRKHCVLYPPFQLHTKPKAVFLTLRTKGLFFEGTSSRCVCSQFSPSCSNSFVIHSWSTSSNQVEKSFHIHGGNICWERWADEFHFALIQCVV